MSSSSRPRGSSSRRRGIAIAAAGTAAVAVAAGALLMTAQHPAATAAAPSGSSFSDVQLAGWTGTPKALTTSSVTGGAAASWCEAGLVADSSAPATVSDLDERGAIASMLVTRGGYTAFCLADGARQGMWETVEAPGTALPRVGPSAIDLGSVDQHGTPAVSCAWGSAGTDVRSVVLHAGGRTITATVGHGFWTAWWPGATPSDTMRADVTTAAGTTTIALGDR